MQVIQFLIRNSTEPWSRFLIDNTPDARDLSELN